MAKPTFSLPVIMDARTTKRLLDDEMNRYGGLIYDGTIVAASDPTLAQQVADDVAASASAAQQSADDAALYDGPRFDTVTDFFASTDTFTAGTYVRTDAEGFAYKAVDTATATTVANTGGQVFEVLPLDAREDEFGALAGTWSASAFGLQNDDITLQKAFNVISELMIGSIRQLVISGRWYLDQTVTLAEPRKVTLDMAGAEIFSTFDGLAIDCNGRADPTYDAIDSLQNFHLVGKPLFRLAGSVSSPTKAAAIRVMGFRNASIELGEVRGYNYDVITGGKDTVYIAGYYSLNLGNSEAAIFLPPWSPIGGPLNFVFEKIHFSQPKAAIKSYMVLNNCVVRDCSFNLASGATSDGVIDVARWVLVGVPSITGGPFTAGETITGGTSGATATLEEVYENPWPFQIAQNDTWLVMKDRSAALFVAGETLTGGTSGASVTVPSNAGYLSQNRSWQDFRIEGINHWESGSSAGAGGTTCIRLRNMENSGVRPVHFNIEAGSLGINGNGSTGVELKGLNSIQVTGRFSQTTGNTPLRLDNCKAVTIPRQTFFSSGVIDLVGTFRTEVDLSDFDKRFTRVVSLSGWEPKLLSDASVTIDMSADFPAFETVGGLPPRNYLFQATVSDSSSAAASVEASRFALQEPGEIVAGKVCTIDVSGDLDGRKSSNSFVVGADGDGDVTYISRSWSTDSLEVFLGVMEMKF